MLGEVTFVECRLGSVDVSGSGILALGTASPPENGALLAGAQLTLGGDAMGTTVVQLMELTWQDPPTPAGTYWRATFDNGTSEPTCLQSSGAPCS